MTYNLLKIYDVIERIDNYKTQLENGSEDLSEMIEIYKFIKESLPYFYHKGELTNYYGRLIASLMTCEEALPKTFIMESNPRFNYYDDSTIDKKLPDEELLDRIALKTRKALMNFYTLDNQNEIINKISFTNDCYDASSIVQEICDDNNIKSYMIELNPGFTDKYNLCNWNCFHYFNIINIKDKYYLIDCTYRQFFKTKGNFLEKIGILNMPGCHPGTFMLMSDERKRVANKILRDGWIELDDKTLKTYLDGFAISYRNGIYYAKTNDYSYEADYTSEDYIKFLKGEDNQVNHEGKDSLGYQRKLVNDKKLT